MASRITELRIKGTDGAFSEAYPIGANAENVYLSDSTTVEDTISNLSSSITSITSTSLAKVSGETLVLAVTI